MSVDDGANDAAPELPKQPPSTRDAYVQAFKTIDPLKDISNLGSMPCARQSLLLGIGGGTAVGAIRFLGSKRVGTSSNWAVATFGLLSLTSWEVCRRSKEKEKAKMQAAMAEYRSKVKVKEGGRRRGAPPSSSNDEAGTTHAPPVGGILMGQKGQEMLHDKRGGERLV